MSYEGQEQIELETTLWARSRLNDVCRRDTKTEQKLKGIYVSPISQIKHKRSDTAQLWLSLSEQHLVSLTSYVTQTLWNKDFRCFSILRLFLCS